MNSNAQTNLMSSSGVINPGHGQNQEHIRDFSNDLGTGIVVEGGNSTSYMGQDLLEFLKMQKTGTKGADNANDRNSMLDVAHSFHHMLVDPSQSKQAATNQRAPSEEPQLYIKIKEENENLKLRVDQLEAELSQEAKKVNDLDRKRERLHLKLEQKDKSISKLKETLKQLKDDIQIVNENIGQAKSSAQFIQAEDESLQELASEMVILLEDCYRKTVVKEDERGNMTIGALNFHDEELLLINQYN